MTDILTALTAVITPAALWGALAALIPIVGVVFIFVLGLTFLRRTVKGASKGKLKF